jgi:hypothetical protein
MLKQEQDLRRLLCKQAALIVRYISNVNEGITGGQSSQQLFTVVNAK